MTYFDMQELCRKTLKFAKQNISVGMLLPELKSMCEHFMLENGAESFWYYGVGAFIFSGNETKISISGRKYSISNKKIQNNDIITIDLSPQYKRIWGDYARTIIIENGKVIEDINEISNAEWKNGLQTEKMLHHAMFEFADNGTTFEQLYFYINSLIEKSGYINLDFLGNLGHSIEKTKIKRKYIEKGNKMKLSDVKYFTFEPHISFLDSEYGYKMENIYYFKNDRLAKL